MGASRAPPQQRVLAAAGPLGLLLGTDSAKRQVLVAGFEPMPTGGIGPVERSGRVRRGDVLVAVDDEPLPACFEAAVELLRKRAAGRRTVTFRTRGAAAEPCEQLSATVVDARIVSQGGAPRFVEYLVFVSEPGSAHKARRWSVWRRYSAFFALDRTLRQQHGWRRGGAELPPRRLFGHFDDAVIRTRQARLDAFLAQLLELGCGAPELRAFLGCDEAAARPEQQQRPQRPAPMTVQYSRRAHRRAIA